MSRNRKRSKPFSSYLRDGVIVGHHIGHDIASLDAACGRHWELQLLNRMPRHHGSHAAPGARRARSRAGRRSGSSASMRCARCLAVIPHDRHTASGDAFITAQIFRSASASRTGRGTIARVCEPFSQRRDLVPDPVHDHAFFSTPPPLAPRSPGCVSLAAQVRPPQAVLRPA